MKRISKKQSLKDIIGRPISKKDVVVEVGQLALADLATAVSAASITVCDYPAEYCKTEFFVSGTQWKISVSLLPNKLPKHCAAALDAALSHATVTSRKGFACFRAGRWVQRVWTSLLIDGDEALRIVEKETTPVFNEALRFINTTLPDRFPRPRHLPQATT